jgi:hypothetical protein
VDTTIPTGVIASVRDGAYELVRQAAEGVVDLLDEGRASREREAYHKALTRLTRAYALLDVIGWQPPEEGRTVAVVGAEHAITLYEALQEGLVSEEHGVEANGKAPKWPS